MALTKETKTLWQYVGSSMVLVIGLVLLVAGFFVDPTGVIDPSVLTAFGEVATFVGSVWGIGNYTQRKLYEIEKKYENNE